MSCIKRIAVLIKIKYHTIMHLDMNTILGAIENITIIKAITKTHSIHIDLIKYISRD
jgi:glycerol-3-phosphate responsive antiterminator